MSGQALFVWLLARNVLQLEHFLLKIHIKISELISKAQYFLNLVRNDIMVLTVSDQLNFSESLYN